MIYLNENNKIPTGADSPTLIFSGVSDFLFRLPRAEIFGSKLIQKQSIIDRNNEDKTTD